MASFSMPLSNEPLLLSVANVLQASGIVQLLKTYPNQRFVDTLTSIAISGAQVGFQGNPVGRTQRPNHSSVLIHPEVISESIQAELRKGRVKKSRISRSITSAPQSASSLSKQMAFKLEGESFSIPHKVPPLMTVSPKNTAPLSMKLSTMQFNW